MAILKWEVQVAIGMRGYSAGPHTFILDRLALSDPLLARLPAERRPNWRAGHYFRKIPEGYLETIKTGKYHFTDRQLAKYHAKLKVVTQGELFKKERLRAIINFNLAAYDHLINKEFYQKFE